MERILITGGAGFIGSHLAAACQDHAPVRVLDDVSTGRPGNLEGFGVEWIRGSILEPADCQRAMAGVDVVFHLAAFVSVAASMEQPEDCARINVLGTLNVLRAAAAAGVRRLIFASSAAVYGEDPVLPKHEALPPDPRSPYAMTKRDGEFYTAMYHGHGALRTASARFFNVYGPRQNPRSPYAAAVPRFVTRALAGEDLVIYGDGSQTRDLIAVADIAAGLLHLAAHPELEGVFNLGQGVPISVKDLAEAILRKTGSRSRLRHEPERPGEIRHSVASIERIRATGWSPRIGLNEGLDSTVAWHLGQRRARS